jgi:hypothetical protein
MKKILCRFGIEEFYSFFSKLFSVCGSCGMKNELNYIESLSGTGKPSSWRDSAEQSVE